MAYMSVYGTFKQRGEESVKNLDTLANVAQDSKVLDLIEVGSAGMTQVGVVTLEDKDQNTGARSLMVTWEYYEFMSFTSEKHLNAYNNFNRNAKSITGAYSNKYDLH